MARIKSIIKSVRRTVCGRKEVKRISDLRINGNGWYLSNGEYFEV